MNQPTTVPIVCDLTTASDTAPQRLSEYHRLFAHALVARERTADGIRFRLRADDGVEAWVRDLAAREKACCAFFEFSITTDADEVRWDTTVIDDDVARAILDDFYALPDTAALGIGAVEDRLNEHGLRILPNPSAPSVR